MESRPRSLLAFALIAISGCAYFDACNYEIRSVQASGEGTVNGVEVAAAQIVLSEQRGSDPDRSIYWIITGANVKGHVVSAAFKDSSDPSTVLLTLPLSTPAQASISEGTKTDKTGANLSGFFELVSAGRGIVEIQTDLYAIDGNSVIIVPVSVTQKQDWFRPNCS
jgi:hypothetical protein